MPESLLERRWKLGRFLGINLYVHWTFALVILYVAFMSRSTGGEGMAFALAQLLGVFLCVTLHEYGHAVAARQFGIGTADITLLPIGGVARLKRMPRIPWQELVVAIAGPAVNVVIGAALILGLYLWTDLSVLASTVRYFVAATFGLRLDDQTIVQVDEVFSSPSVLGFLMTMLIVNLMLVLFNLIPAFPMDGGRVFRSLLAMGIDYRMATRIAARVGLGCAGVFALLALTADPPRLIPVLVAMFVAYAGMAEARQVDVMESMRGLRVGDVMFRSTETLSMDMPLGQIIQRWQSTSATTLPVVSIVGTVVGMLDLQQIQHAVVNGVDLRTPAGQLIDHGNPTITMQPHESLDTALMRTGRNRGQIPVVDDQDQLCGIVDVESMIIRGNLAAALTSHQWPPIDRFDQSS